MASSRLPTALRPVGYDLTLRTDFDSTPPSFSAVIRTTLYVQDSTHQVVFHAGPSLSLGSASVISTDLSHSHAQQDVYRSYDTSLERVTLHFLHELRERSQVVLTVHYTGVLESNMRGYYYCSTRIDGNPVKYSATMFEPISARLAFPCWDEPALKATFSMGLVSRPNMVNLFNMPIISELPCPQEVSQSLGPGTGEWKLTRFGRTPPMSTYLAAWGTGPFQYIFRSYTSPLSGVTRPLKVYGTVDLLEHAHHTLDVTAKVMPIYERMFDIEFPLPKLDTLLSIEAGGAMENWGLIIGSAAAYRVDPKRADVAQRLWVGSMQAHEVAHQWFGNITTMRWWDNTYLNEGFATWAGERALGIMFPEYDMDTRFATEILHGPGGALIADAKLTSHPIEVPIPTEGTIGQVFDAVTYQKAGSLLRMCASYVGIDSFLKGVSTHLKRHLYGNATSAELWEVLSEVANVDLTTLLKEWLGQTGYPLLTVSEKHGRIHVQQNRFWERGDLPKEKDNVIWQVPLFVLSQSGNEEMTEHSRVLKDRSITLTTKAKEFLKLNTGSMGLYRVHYTGDLFTRVKEEAVRHDSLFTPADLVGLVSDTVALTKAGLVPAIQALGFIDLLQRAGERNYFVLETIGIALDEMTLLWRDDAVISVGLRLLQQHIFTPHVRRLGFVPIVGEPMLDDQLRQLAIKEAASAGEEGTVKELVARVKDFLASGDENEIPLGITQTALSTAVRVCGGGMFDAVKERFTKSQDPNAQMRYLRALAASPNGSLLLETLRELKRGNIQYFLSFIGEVARNGQATLISKFFMDNYEEMTQIGVGTGIAQARAVQSCFQYLKSQEEHDAVVKFFAKKDTSKFHLGLDMALENILSNAAWLSRSSKDMAAWLEKWQEKA